MSQVLYFNRNSVPNLNKVDMIKKYNLSIGDIIAININRKKDNFKDIQPLILGKNGKFLSMYNMSKMSNENSSVSYKIPLEVSRCFKSPNEHFEYVLMFMIGNDIVCSEIVYSNGHTELVENFVTTIDLDNEIHSELIEKIIKTKVDTLAEYSLNYYYCTLIVKLNGVTTEIYYN